MSEKRFTKCDTKIRDNGEEMTQAEVRDMLNKLHDENEQLKSFKQRVFDLIDKTIEEETQIAENIEEVTQETRPYCKAVNRLTIKTLENLKWELQE